MACNSYTSGSDAQANLSLGTVSVDPCPSTIQQMAQAIINALTVTLPGNFATFNIGSDTPTPANRDKLWYRVDASCNPLGWYLWTGAAWTRATPLGTPPGLVSHWWSAALVGLTPAEAKNYISYLDTGDTPSIVSPHSTPFWWLCDGTNTPQGNTTPNLLGRVIVGAGNGSGLTVRAQGDTGGEESHTLSEAELPAHAHAAQNGSASVAVTSAGPFIGYGFNPLPANTSGLTGGGLAHQNMPPYNCVYPVIRTARTI